MYLFRTESSIQPGPVKLKVVFNSSSTALQYLCISYDYIDYIVTVSVYRNTSTGQKNAFVSQQQVFLSQSVPKVLTFNPN